MSSDPQEKAGLRPAILGPVHLGGLRRHLSATSSAGRYPEGMGGYCINTLIEARLRRGWRTDVVTLDDKLVPEMVRFEGPLLRVWVVRRRKTGALRDFFSAEQRLLMRALDEARPDVLHANWTYEYGLTAIRQIRYPHVVTVHDHAGHCLRWLGWRYLPMYLITQYVLRNAVHLTAVSPYVGRYLERKLRRPVPVIPNMVPQAAWEAGIHRGIRSTGASRETTVRIVSAINWSDLKNTRNALLAFRLARQLCVEQMIDLKYTLMGRGLEPGGPAESWAVAHACMHGVSFKGVMPHEDALREMAGADVLFHPSHEEAMPGPVCEAMAMRLPVVACREAAGSQWLCGEDRGYLCDGRAPRTMAERIVEASLKPVSARCGTAHAWLAGLTSDEKILGALDLAYTRACAPKV